jgi:hypothetical protein
MSATNKKISTNTHNNNNNKSPGGSRLILSPAHTNPTNNSDSSVLLLISTRFWTAGIYFFSQMGNFFCASSNGSVPANSEGRNLASLLSLVHKRLNVNRVLFLGAQVDDTCVHVCTSLIGRIITCLISPSKIKI